jgi:hypothetical protein
VLDQNLVASSDRLFAISFALDGANANAEPRGGERAVAAFAPASGLVVAREVQVEPGAEVGWGHIGLHPPLMTCVFRRMWPFAMSWRRRPRANPLRRSGLRAAQHFFLNSGMVWSTRYRLKRCQRSLPGL